MTANLQRKDHIGEAILYMAMESSGTEWRLDFSSGARIESRRLWLELESLVRTNQSCQGATTLTVRLLQRYVNGERKSVSVLRVPTPDEEDQRCLNRERKRLIKERGAHVVRIESLLVRIGIHMPIVRNFPEWLENVGDGLANEPGSDLEAELLWEYERLQLAARQLEELLQEQKRRVEEEDTKATERIMTSIQSKGIG